ncbi:MAG TPA: hypothetical protein VF222_09750 [Nitrososphaeraceae archaeon]
MHLLSLFIEEDVKYGCYAANLTPILFFNTILILVLVLVIVFSVASLVFEIVIVVIKILIVKINMFSDDGVYRDGRECTN